MRLLLTLALALLLAAPARAGTYEHYTVSPPSPGLDGWSPFVVAPGGFAGTGVVPGALIVHFWARSVFLPGERAGWVYTPPADTTVASWDVERMVSGIGGGHWNTLLSATVDGRSRLVWGDAPSNNRPWAHVGAAGLGASQLSATLQCGGPHSCVPAGTAQLTLRNSTIVLHDPYAPEVADVQGDLARSGPLKGTVGLSFAATDRGGGVYRAYAEVDGRAGPPVEIGDGRCRDIIPGGSPYQFAFRQPCPLTAGATVAVDSAKLPDGPHVIAVRVEDAAGNTVTVHGPVTRTVDNLPDAPPHPTPTPSPSRPPAPLRPAAPPRPLLVTARLERGHRRGLELTAGYGERVRIRGRVTDRAGQPVAGAALALAERVELPGRRWRPITGVGTLPDGRFTAFARVGPSRRLRITAPDGARAPVLTLRVRAAVTVRWAAGLVRGRLRGGVVPRGGAFVELQRRERGGWRPAGAVRTYRSGAFAARVAPGRVRAVVPRQPGLPFARGVSSPRTARRTAPRTSR